MDIGEAWVQVLAWLPHDWPGVVLLFEQLFANQLMRGIGLLALVYITIRIIASVYSGEKNRAELGPVAIRSHISGRYNRRTVRVPHQLIEMGLDGVLADCKVFYAYTDANGRRRRELVKEIKDAKISVSPTTIPVGNKEHVIYGQEVPPVPRENVCFPLDIEEPEATVPPPDEDARAYAARHNIIEKWQEDDGAITISLASDVREEIAAAKVEFILDSIAEIQKAKAQWFSRRTSFKRLWKNRANVVGSYYLQFEFSHNPFFVLTRHPDRDLKMTAWLTVLTSVFALLMDAWPIRASGSDRPLTVPEFQNVETRPMTPRPPVVVPPS